MYENCLVLINQVRPHAQIMCLWRAQWLDFATSWSGNPWTFGVRRCLSQSCWIYEGYACTVMPCFNEAGFKNWAVSKGIPKTACRIHLFQESLQLPSLRHCYVSHNRQQRNRKTNLEVLKSWSYHLLPRLNSVWLKKMEINVQSQESLQNANINFVSLENFVQWQNEKEPQKLCRIILCSGRGPDSSLFCFKQYPGKEIPLFLSGQPVSRSKNFYNQESSV